ncbi:MAG: dTMP kinase [Candidatus Woesearchaeota archaeon]|jgi:dTMP kinase|nr:dTMP kinase [Candidatus Woesearchaeota archaeon]MDP7622511.1 dTMP kinase [Candidatus Woesearchaeota archaeon]HJN56591.1 dTMP kinase [Candidatus Woesearchaeota archaeon]|tara:strand:+ start:43111 stop:43731 length:621 start_codon:yes stop_codon:yes gene_type:complete
MANGIFIVLDGMDGSGKSELVKLLHNYLFSKNKKYRILTTREPTNGTHGNEIREILANEKDPKQNADKLLDLFIKDREDHLKNIIMPFLEKSNNSEINIVLCDRYYYSTIAFQATQGLDINMLIQKNKNFLKPNIVFIMDLNPETALERIKHRQKEKFEQIEFMNSLRKKFLELPKLLEDNIKIIDASKEINEVFEEIKKEIIKLL